MASLSPRLSGLIPRLPLTASGSPAPFLAPETPKPLSPRPKSARRFTPDYVSLNMFSTPRNGPTFEDLLEAKLKPPLDRANFLAYLKSHNCQDHVDFLEQVEAFKKADKLTQLAKAREICSRFIEEGSDQELHITSSTRNLTLSYLQDGNMWVQPALFDFAQQEVNDTLRIHKFQPFLNAAQRNIDRNGEIGRYVVAFVFIAGALVALSVLVLYQNLALSPMPSPLLHRLIPFGPLLVGFIFFYSAKCGICQVQVGKIICRIDKTEREKFIVRMQRLTVLNGNLKALLLAVVINGLFLTFPPYD